MNVTAKANDVWFALAVIIIKGYSALPLFVHQHLNKLQNMKG